MIKSLLIIKHLPLHFATKGARDMARKEFIRLLESNILTLDRLAERLRKEPLEAGLYPKNQMTVLVRLHMGGRARLKEIARRELVPAPNLCATFRKLERDGLVARTIDENDRRNTWYECTPAGEKLADKAMEMFRCAISRLFENIAPADETALTGALKIMNEILTKMEIKHV